MVQLAGIEQLVAGAAGDPDVQAAGAVHQAVDVDALRDDAKARDGAAVDLRQYRAVGRCAHVERLVPPAVVTLRRQASGDAGQRSAVA